MAAKNEKKKEYLLAPCKPLHGTRKGRKEKKLLKSQPKPLVGFEPTSRREDTNETFINSRQSLSLRKNRWGVNGHIIWASREMPLVARSGGAPASTGSRVFLDQWQSVSCVPTNTWAPMHSICQLNREFKCARLPASDYWSYRRRRQYTLQCRVRGNLEGPEPGELERWPEIVARDTLRIVTKASSLIPSAGTRGSAGIISEWASKIAQSLQTASLPIELRTDLIGAVSRRGRWNLLKERKKMDRSRAKIIKQYGTDPAVTEIQGLDRPATLLCGS
ncbi:hypothetical protein DFH09DRAFT_1115335 [Mycena vulgaris]|nr:hypothetical protein DFH09DRAFT_1115335 [Mycena vulgaris]